MFLRTVKIICLGVGLISSSKEKYVFYFSNFVSQYI